jgi:DNA-binding NarL/FixJ family response regulator
MINVAIVEDNLLHADYILAVVSSFPNCHVLTIKTDAFDFLNYCTKEKQLPDIALVDLEMRGMDGVSLTDYLTNYFPDIKVMALSSHTHIEAVEDMFACGAKGYVVKIFPPGVNRFEVLPSSKHMAHLEEAINTIINGGYYIDPNLINSSANEYHAFDIEKLVARRQAENKGAASLGLTKREKMMSSLYASASGTKQEAIASVLNISTNTLDKQIQSASAKLNVNNRQMFTLRSISLGIIKIARGLVGKVGL